MLLARMFKYAVVCWLLAATAGAYTYFGKNKVQYYDYDWQILEGDHVDLYFYSSERALAERALASAEDAWDRLTARMAFTPRSRVPLIIYSSHAEFAETNVYPYILPEGVGGFTELFKNRVVIPFEGSYPKFERVIRHELTHYIMYEKLRDVYARHNRFGFGPPPFWYVEGLAEYLSGEGESYSNMVVADALYSGNLVPLTAGDRLTGSYLGYKEGESALRYLAATYGEAYVTRVLDLAWLSSNYDEVLDRALPKPLERFDDEWRRWLRTSYAPRYGAYTEFAALGPRVTDGNAFRSGIAWLDRRRLVYLANESGYANVHLVSLDDDGNPVSRRTLVNGERSQTFASLYTFEDRLATWGERLVAFSAGVGARDRLYVFDVDRNKVVERYEFEEILSIGTPAFSPDGTAIVFRGVSRKGRADLYVVTRANGELRRLTDDAGDDEFPCWTDAGIIFASDRAAAAGREDYNLYRLDPTGGETVRLTAGPWTDRYPVSGTDGSLVFVSDRDGFYDVYALAADGTLTRMTRALTGVLEATPRPGNRGSEFALLAIDGQNYEIRTGALKAMPEPTPAPPSMGAGPFPYEGPPRRTYPVKRYRTSYSLDYFSTEIAYGPEFGTQTGMVVSLTDLLNDRSIVGALGNDAQTLDDFLARTSVGVDYYNLHKRLGWGVGGFHYVNDYTDYAAGIAGRDYTETRAGGTVAVTYPLDRFHRMGGSLYGYEMKREWEIGRAPEFGTKAAPYVSAARDTSLWYADGPIDGQRFQTTVGITEDLRQGRPDYLFGILDLRYYLRTTRRQCFAFRLASTGSFGPDATPIYAGGSLSMRGYEFFSWAGRRFAMVNAEYRFPLLDPSPLRTAVGTTTLPRVRGALFCDAGQMWDEPGREPQPKGLHGGFGVSARVVLWDVLTLRTDHTWRYSRHELGPFIPIKFFVGWSY